MITYKCKNCGGQMKFGGTGGFTCPFCGSKTFFSDKDFKDNEKFRKLLLEYYKAEAEKKEFDYSKDSFFNVSGTESFTMVNGQPLEINYMEKREEDGYVCFLAKESVIYVFDKEKDADDFFDGIKRLEFPAADDKLRRSFPELKMEINLKSKGKVLVFLRRPNLYPASMFAPYESVHLAWIISRMENICCALEYSELMHGNITSESVWINPFTHEGCLFGDWRKVKSKRSNGDLSDLRKTAIELAEDTSEPEELYRFLNTAPESDAYADFEKWDKVIMDGFGGHNFVKMKL